MAKKNNELDPKQKVDKKDAKAKDTGKKKNKKNIFKRIAGFFNDSANEVKKIVWPTPRAVFKNMGIVLVVIAIIGTFIFLLDTGLIALLGQFMGIAA